MGYYKLCLVGRYWSRRYSNFCCFINLQTKMEKGATLKYLDQKATEWKLQKGGSRVQQMNVDQLQICIDELRLKKPA